MTTVAPLPSSRQPIGNLGQGGLVFVQPVWQRWFNAFTQSAPPVLDITTGTSPTSFAANVAGTLFVSGGTVSSIVLQRGTVSLNTGSTSGFVPMSIGDIVVVTYSVAPTIQFIPS